MAQVWHDKGSGPKLVFERNLQAGPLFACQPCNDEPRILGFTGPGEAAFRREVRCGP